MEKRYVNWKPMKLKYKFHNCYFGLHVIWGCFVEYGWITKESGLDFSTTVRRDLAVSLLFIAPTVGVGRLDEERMRDSVADLTSAIRLHFTALN
jgi:hypothetical protein